MNVVILGRGPRSIVWPAGAQVWAINHSPAQANRIFHLHGPHHRRNDMTWLRDAVKDGKRVFLPPSLDLPSWAEPFPYGALETEFRRGGYLTHSVPALIALAVFEKAESIAVDGVHHGNGGRAEDWSVPCINYWLGVAEGRDIQVIVERGTGLLDYTHTYGLEGPGSI